MRLLRAKAGRKTLGFYRVAFGLKAPYRVLLDGTFIHHALSTVKTTIVARLEKMFGKGVGLFVSRAVLAEMKELGLTDALNFCEESCRKVGKRGGSVEESMVELASEKFVVASQDPSLKKRLHSIPGVAVVTFSGTVLLLEQPSSVSLRTAAKAERRRARPDDEERTFAKRIRDKERGVVSSRRTKKRPAGPNPLSCKKKGARSGEDAERADEKENGGGERRRPRKRQRRRSQKESSE